MIISQLGATGLYSTFAGLATLLGVFFILKKESWAKRNSFYLISFSAGVILTIGFLHLLPEAIENTRYAFHTILFTILGFYTLEHVMVIHHCNEEDCDVHTLSSVAVAGMIFHSLLDGFIIGVSFEASAKIGIVAAFGVLLHKIPVGLSVTSMLLHDNIERAKVLRFGILIALATPVGAILSFFITRQMPPQALGILLAISAGSFVYLGASDLLPETHKKQHKSNILMVFLGVGIILVAGLF